jgi:flagellar biosynthesis/type III secretory pathway chaperone
MMPTQTDKIVDRLIRVTEAERKVLTTGQLDDLVRLEDIKRKLLVRLARQAGRADPAALEQLRRQALQNHRLYEASLTGIRNIRDQVRDLVRGAELKTYGADGARTALAEREGTLKRRA